MSVRYAAVHAGVSSDKMTMLSARPTTKLVLASIIVFGLFYCGCSKRDPTVWKTEVLSPDSQWVASASTEQNGGFGNAYIGTGVSLQKRGASGPPTTVLFLSCSGPMPRPYVLDNVANAGGSIHLSITWVSPSHLHVSYDSNPTVIFQQLRVGSIDITLEDRSQIPDGKQR